jgi:hypothetical protein
MAPVFEEVFRSLYGKPCWNVELGLGSFLTFEFGKPHLVVRKPVTAKKDAPAKVQAHLAQRHAYVSGEWHLWISYCNWEVYLKGRHIGGSSTRQSARSAVDFLNGQKLVEFSISPRKVQSTFLFDLGGVLKTLPYDRGSEQWLLYVPPNKVLALRADARYRYGRSDKSADDREWKPI